MAYPVIMPKTGMSMEEGTILRWLKCDGDAVRKGEMLLEIETDKTSMEVRAEADGLLLRVLDQAGKVVPVTQTIAWIGQPGEPLSEAAGPAELGVPLAGVSGTGPFGAVRLRDLAGAEERATKGAAAVAEGQPLAGLRRTIADKMVRSWQVPSPTLITRVDVTELAETRSVLNAQGDLKVSFTDLVVKAAATALRERPLLNSTFEDGRFVRHEEVNIGVAVALEDGLVVPVLHRADTLSLSQADIGRRFGISRSSVSIALKACRKEGIVEIRIDDSPSALLRLQAELKGRYRLTAAVVAPAEADSELAKRRVGQAAAVWLEGELTSLASAGLRIGLSWGTTLFLVVHHLRSLELSGVEVVQLHGGLGAEDPAIDAFGLAQGLAEKLHGRYRVIQAPISVASRELRKQLVRESGIAETMKRGAQADLALFGVGSNRPRSSSLVRTGFLSAAKSSRLLDAGAVGTVCGVHIDAEGRPFPCPWNERLVGIGAEALLRIPRRVVVAAGLEKVEAVRAALRGGLIGTLVADEGLAQALL